MGAGLPRNGKPIERHVRFKPHATGLDPSRNGYCLDGIGQCHMPPGAANRCKRDARREVNHAGWRAFKGERAWTIF